MIAKKQTTEEEFNIHELAICWFISSLMIIGVVLFKQNIDLKKQQQQTLRAMEVAIKLSDEKKELEKQKAYLFQYIDFQKSNYETNISKYQKYDKIIKDIDRNWDKSK